MTNNLPDVPHNKLPQEHGTERGYHQHKKCGETTCVECRIAHVQTVKEYKDKERAKKRGTPLPKKQQGGSQGTGVDFADIPDMDPVVIRKAGLVMTGVAIDVFPDIVYWEESTMEVLGTVLQALGIKGEQDPRGSQRQRLADVQDEHEGYANY